jgi:hypothetical protein
MKNETALRLLAEHLQWSDSELAVESPGLQLLIGHKYDTYQGFQPATRFHIALLNWLSQFETVDEKRTAFSFVKKHLIFISQREMYHLVSLMMPTIDRLMRQHIASALGIEFYKTWLLPEADKRLDLMRRRTLFVGLSDGAKIDVFRRYNEGAVSNEQVLPFNEISDLKWDNLRDELKKWLDNKPEFANELPKFEAICLVDDFSGSGSSLLRKDEKSGEWKGKIARFYQSNASRIGEYLTDDCKMYIHHYLASKQAEVDIGNNLKEFQNLHSKFTYKVTFSYVLPQDIVINSSTNPAELVKLFEDYYDHKVADDHTGQNIWFGYKSCGLPLVLDHNTPNNSVAILWASSPDELPNGKLMKPLFTRRKRHSSHG